MEEEQIFEVQAWRQVRGPAGAVMCETRDWGVKWPYWHTLMFDGQETVDMRVVCPQGVKKMLLTQARTVYWRRWTVRHECEDLKEGVWLDIIQAMLRRKINEAWTDKHHNVMRKLVVEGGWVQRRLYDIGWSHEKKCRGCNKEEGMEKHRLCHCPWLEGNQKPDPRWNGEMRAKSKDTKERREVAKRNRNAPFE